MLLSPLARNASSAHFCAGSVIPALGKEVTVQLACERVMLLENQLLMRNHLEVESYFYLEKQQQQKKAHSRSDVTYLEPHRSHEPYDLIPITVFSIWQMKKIWYRSYNMFYNLGNKNAKDKGI